MDDSIGTMYVTGGAGGIGSAIVVGALPHWDVVVVDLEDPAPLLREAIGTSEDVGFVHLDITDQAAVSEWASSQVADSAGDLCLVNAAGIARYGTVLETSPEQWRETLEVNLTGAFFMTQALAHVMVGRGGGSIVSVASVGSVAPSPNTGAYTPSKAALARLMELVAVELGPVGIRANCVSPGFVDGGLAAGFYTDPEVRAGREAMVPARRLATPADVADAVLFLASPRATYINGHNLLVDGGLSVTSIAAAPRFEGDPVQPKAPCPEGQS